MKAISITAVHGRLNREKDGKKQIEICVYFPDRRQRVYRTTGLWVKNFADGKINSREKDHVSLNRNLERQKKELHDLYDDFQLKGKPFTPDDLRRHLNGEDMTVTFNKFFADTVRKQRIRQTTGTNKLITLRYLNEFNPELRFAEINYQTILEFDEFLAKLKFKSSTVFKIHSHLKNIIHEAVKLDHMVKSPYLKFQMRKPHFKKYALTEDEVNRIYELPYSEARDMFLISCCTGLRFSDASVLTGEQIKEIGGEMYVHVEEMRKVEGRGIMNKATVAFPFGEDLLRTYYKKSGRIFNQYNSVTNAALVKIGQDANIAKPVTFHISRHTFLTQIAVKTGSIFSVMKAGGISSVSTAQGYVDMASELIGG